MQLDLEHFLGRFVLYCIVSDQMNINIIHLLINTARFLVRP